MFENVWKFETKRFRVTAAIREYETYEYDGEDENGETQRKIDSGEFVAFECRVMVEVDGYNIGSDYLGGCVYDANQIKEFWTAHRDANPMNRNCSIMRAARADNVVICHYFPDMVRIACGYAREFLAGMPKVRTA